MVREFPAVEVRALLDDLRSSETVHTISGETMRALPVDRLAEVLELKPGVVAQGEELHVRGGRSGELAVTLDGMSLREPLRGRPMAVPMNALESAELVSGAPDAQHGGGIAGALNLRSADPAERPELLWKWQTDGGTETRYDRVTARLSSPILQGLGMVAAGDAWFDDSWLPSLRTESRHDVAGVALGWRDENQILGSFKIAPVSRPERFSAEVLVSRRMSQPYSPSWSVDGWIEVPVNLKETPKYSPVEQPGYIRYRAADHLAVTDDQQLATQIRLSTPRGPRHASLGLGWLRTRTWTSIAGRRQAHDPIERPRFGSALDNDRFYVLWGDDPLYRESGSDVYSVRGDAEIVGRRGTLGVGVGVSREDARLYEMDHLPLAARSADPLGTLPLDSVRTYDVSAPAAFSYVQGRWQFEGMVLNAGVRAEYFTAGSAADDQTLPGDGAGIWSFGPRLGVAYPISVRDVFSLAYVRLQQSPGRDYLYDQRTVIGNRQPLGNPALGPATSISYQAAVKHLFGPAWAMQSAVFYRDIYGQVGALDAEVPQGPINLRYVDEDQGHAVGFEWTLTHSPDVARRIEASYTWMQAWGNESRPEGDPFGAVRSARTPAIGNQPLSWDRRHTIALSGAWRWRERWQFGWSSVVGSPFPWTPKPLRQPFSDLSVVNSRRLDWTENTNVSLQWSPRYALGLTFGIEARNLFDGQYERAATVDGSPNPVINTTYDDYGAYRTETGLGGGAYWSQLPGTEGHWVPVHDARLYNAPRSVRASIGARW